MNPQLDPTPGLRLPQPSVEPMPIQAMPAPVAQPQPAMPIENPATSAMQTAQQPQPVISQPQMAQQATQPVNTTDADLDNDDMWIGKAKTVLEQFKSDPYSQSNALSKLKSDYLKSRHNITTKLVDNQQS